jgi:hypothetical protein
MADGRGGGNRRDSKVLISALWLIVFPFASLREAVIMSFCGN